MAFVSLPQHCPTPREQDDLELLLDGAYAPRDRFESDGPISLTLPQELRDQAVELVDPEGLPLARRDTDGTLTRLADHVTGAFRRLQLSPAQAREQHAGALPVVLAGPPSSEDLALVQQQRGGRPALLLVLTGHGTPQGVSAVGLLRIALAAADLLGEASVIAVPYPSHGDAETDHALAADVVGTYTTGEVLALSGTGGLPEQVEAILAQDQPADDERGLVVFFTGLSGSGKSTLARELHDRVLEDGRRTVTTLDGDVVRRHLSAGLGFSKADRETNILRIGWVAAEIARNRGLAICSPIAPFDQTRQQVRHYVEDAGGTFFLVHVSTPLEECERRDKKGLYAKARRGEIGEFTGISSPYEEPADADVVVDTTGRSIEDALGDVLDALRDADLLDLPGALDG